MKPAARQFYRTALIAFRHAYDHSLADNESDAVQVVLLLDFGIEMLLKAVLLNKDESIMNGKMSINLIEALKRSGPYKQGSTVEILRERRNNLQHFAQYTDKATTRDLYEGALLFVEEVLDTDLKENLPSDLRLLPLRIPTLSSTRLLAPSDQLQRDVYVRDDVVVWAQGVPNSNFLTVHVCQAGGEPRRLTHEGDFEYLPKTDGQTVVAYRQSGGIVHHNLENGERTVISETGAPTDITDRWIAAQGLTVEGGIGGGVWLYDRASKIWEQLSDEGDSARFTMDYIIWSELVESDICLKYKRLGRTDAAQVLVRSAAHPSVSGNRIAWDSRGSEPVIHVGTLEGVEIYSTPGFFPNLQGDVLAYLVKEGDDHTLKVDDVMRRENILSAPRIGFPVGSGPVIGKGAIFFESKQDRSVHSIYQMGFEY